MVLSEHNIKDNEISKLKLQGFSVDSFYCRKVGNKGGVLIMSKNGFGKSHVTIPSCELCDDKIFEYCAVKYKFNAFHIIIIAVYRSPSSDVNVFLHRLNILITNMLKKCTHILIVGDININILQNSKSTTDLKTILKSHGMTYLVDFPTRTCSTTQTSIDNFLTNLPSNILGIEGLITNLSDHDAQVLKINDIGNVLTQRNITCYKRKFTDENKELFLKFLANEEWYDVYNADITVKFDIFFNIFYYYFDCSFPKVKSRVSNNHSKWINSELTKTKNNIVYLEENFRITKNKQLKTFIKDKKRMYNIDVNSAKKSYYDTLISNSGNACKTAWSIVNNEINVKNRTVKQNISLDHNNVLVERPETVCNIFCDYYTNLVDNQIIPNLVQSDKTAIPIKSDFKLIRKFSPEPVSCDELDHILKNFKNKYSTGCDEVPMPIIKHAKHYLLKPLTHVINSSFISGIFPERLKISKTKPLFKSGNERNVENYRPLSLISSFSKLFEKVMANRFTAFLGKNSILDDNQHGFRPGRSVITASIEFIESIIDSLDKNEKVVSIFMDLSKAFDSVCHSKLLSNLSDMGVNDRTLSWFESYLTNRKHFVEISYLNAFHQISSARSQLSTVKFGIPQGSILGPLLFICYMQGLPKVAQFDKLILYADDISLKVSGKTVQHIEESSYCKLSSVHQFLLDKQLLLNPTKTKYINFCLRNNKKNSTETNIFIEDHYLDETEEAKFLGLRLDKNLNWNFHVEHVCNKMASGLFALRKLSPVCDAKTLKSVYFSLIHSHISFGIILYGSTSYSNLSKILILQKHALRIMLNLNWSDSVKDHFANLGIMTVFGLYIFELILFIKQNALSLAALGDSHSYNTRFRGLPSFHRHNLRIFEKKPSYAGIRFYNHLPIPIKNIDDLNKFKNKLKQYMLLKSLYSIEEFFQDP